MCIIFVHKADTDNTLLVSSHSNEHFATAANEILVDIFSMVGSLLRTSCVHNLK